MTEAEKLTRRARPGWGDLGPQAAWGETKAGANVGGQRQACAGGQLPHPRLYPSSSHPLTWGGLEGPSCLANFVALGQSPSVEASVSSSAPQA